MALSSSGQDSGLSSRRRQGRNLQESPIKYDRRTRLRRVKQNGGMRVVEFIFFICLCSLVGQSIRFIPERSLVQIQPQTPYGGVEQWQLVVLISRRLQVRILPPHEIQNVTVTFTWCILFLLTTELKILGTLN